eukprot:COSAG01_NODE_8663_length_2704_cov_6.110173_2_plen_176_part_00
MPVLITTLRMETPGQVRTSQNTFLNRGADERIEGLERRVHAMTRTWCVRVVWHVPRAVLRVRVEIMGSPKFRSVRKSQCVLIMIDPIVSTRVPVHRRDWHPPPPHTHAVPRGAVGVPCSARKDWRFAVKSAPPIVPASPCARRRRRRTLTAGAMPINTGTTRGRTSRWSSTILAS